MSAYSVSAEAGITEAVKPRIVALLPRGEAIRNFVYTGSLDELSRNAEITALSVIPTEELGRLLASRSFSLRPLETYPERYPVRLLREVLDLAHGRNLWSKAAQERWYLRDVEAVTSSEKLKRVGKKALCYPFANRPGLRLLSTLERTASRWLRTSDEFLRLYGELKPSLVFNASHVHSQLAIQAVQAAQWLGIPTATFIFSWDNLTSQGRILPAYDHYLVWNEDIRKQLLRIYPEVRPEQIVVTGTPQFDFHFRPEFYWSRATFCERIGTHPDRPIVLYSTGMANHMPGEDRVVEGIADMLLDMSDLGSPQLLVRVYPKDLTGRFNELKQRRKDILFPTIPWEPAFLTPKYEDLYLLTNTIRHCAAGVNIASTISLELCMFDKPTINVGYDPPGMDIHPISFGRYYQFDHYKPVVDSGAVEVVYSERDMSTRLRLALTCPEQASHQRRAFLRRMFDETLDGHSGSRVSRVLLDLASQSAPVCV
jgi:hypothetical protein